MCKKDTDLRDSLQHLQTARSFLIGDDASVIKSPNYSISGPEQISVFAGTEMVGCLIQPIIKQTNMFKICNLMTTFTSTYCRSNALEVSVRMYVVLTE